MVQKTAAEYLKQQLGWDSVYAYNNEDFGTDGLLGRKDDREIEFYGQERIQELERELNSIADEQDEKCAGSELGRAERGPKGELQGMHLPKLFTFFSKPSILVLVVHLAGEKSHHFQSSRGVFA